MDRNKREADSQGSIVLGRRVGERISALRREVESAATSKGYRVVIVPLTERPAPHIHGRTRFVDEKTIEVSVATDLTEELFNPTLGEELMHAWQNVQHYPKIRPRRELWDGSTKSFADDVSTKVLDIHAHRELRGRGVSTKPLGLQTYQGVLRELLSKEPDPRLDELTGDGKLSNALSYVRLYFALHEDPEIPRNLWEEAEQRFKLYPKTRDLGLSLIRVIEEEGLENPDQCRRVLRRIMAPFDFKAYFQIFAGPPSGPGESL